MRSKDTGTQGDNHDMRWSVDRAGHLRVDVQWAVTLGYSQERWLDAAFVRRVTHPADLHVWPSLIDLDADGLPADRTVRIERPDGHMSTLLLRATSVTADGGSSGVGLDITGLAGRASAASADLFEDRADPLTGLPNRSALVDHLESRLRRGEQLGLIVADLDRFRMVNEAMGHQIGDRLIVAVAQRFAGRLNNRCRLFRLAADEFAIVTDQQSVAGDLAADLGVALDRPFEMGGIEIQVSATIGVAETTVGDLAGQTPGELLRAAEVAMYSAKKHGSAVTTHRPGLRQTTRHELALIAELRRAIAQRELEIVYQPIVDTRTGRVAKLEALVRWRHRRRGLLLPHEFIESAEETRLIHPLTRWLLAEVALHLRHQLPPHIRVAVNVSVRNLEDRDFGSFVELLGTVDALDPKRLELEITERDLMDDPAAALDVVGQVRRAGIAVVMDDFGTGHASLAALKELPIDGFKLDRSFVTALADDTQDRAIVAALAQLASTLGLSTTAEGVTDAVALRFLRDVGLDTAQGFWLARPASPAELPDAIRRAETQAIAALGLTPHHDLAPRTGTRAVDF